MGVAGAAWATVIAQWISGVGILIYTKVRCPWLNLECRHMHMCRENISEITQASVLTCLQQSVMNLGILMVQGLVNSFGTVVMAAFAAAELRSRQERPYQKRDLQCSPDFCPVCPGCIGNCCHMCKTTSSDFCPCTGNTDIGSRYVLSARGWSLLLWNRDTVFTVWIVSGD